MHIYMHVLTYVHIHTYTQAIETLRSEHEANIEAVHAEAKMEMKKAHEEHQKGLKALK
jgi:hypothetical protein